MTTTPAGITVSGLLQSLPETVGLDLDLLAGGTGLTRRITGPYVQKTGLALAGFDEYLQPGRERQLQPAGMDQADDSEIEDGFDPGEEQ